MNRNIIIVLTLLLFTACEIEKKPKVRYGENSEAKTAELKKDSSLLKIADSPIHFDSTNYLIHPIGEYKVYNESRSYYGSSGGGSNRFNVSRLNRYGISGYLHNIKFEELDSGNFTTLTQKSMIIKSVNFLYKTCKTTGKEILIYKVVDKDTNKDRKLNDDDITTLYISNIDGSDFTKLTTDMHELINWKIISVKNRLYFRSIEDSNRNGKFDIHDKIFYQYVNLLDENWEVMKYAPI